MIRRKRPSRTADGAQKAVVAAVWGLLGSRPWREITVASVARTAKMPLANVLAVAPSRCDLLAMLLRDLGRETVRRYRAVSAEQSIHERLFIVVMSWFDAISIRKKAVRGLVRDLAREPFTLLRLRGEILRVAEMLVALAEADVGRSPTMRAGGLAAVVARAIPIWLEDARGLDRTMAQVDRDLRRLERYT